MRYAFVIEKARRNYSPLHSIYQEHRQRNWIAKVEHDIGEAIRFTPTGSMRRGYPRRRRPALSSMSIREQTGVEQ
jgi:hypothetical protein